MPIRYPFVALLLLVALARQVGADAPGWGELALETADGVTVHGYVLPAPPDPERPLILLFHQAGTDARGEYERIAPRLVATGYQVIAIDQRSGGDRFGTNRTVAGLAAGTGFGYCSDLADLEAALAFALNMAPGQKVVLWGSSYSAALVFRLAVDHPAVAGVVAFSPASGDPMAGCEPEPVLAGLEVPAIVFRPASEMEYQWIADQMETFRDAHVTGHVAEHGVHGSSMLDENRTRNSTEREWQALERFLGQLELPH